MIDFATTKLVKSTKIKAKKVILDIESYSTFLNWCDVKKILTTQNKTLAKVKVGQNGLKYSFDCEIFDFENKILIQGKKFLQFSFVANWEIIEKNQDVLQISFDIKIDFPLKILEKKLESMIKTISLQVIEKFTQKIEN